MKQPTIQIENLTIGYPTKGKPKTVAKDISATLYGGELTCLLGANGVGKSTLLRTLSTSQTQLAGKVYIKGKETTEYTHKELSHLIALVLTERPDIQNITATELVELGRTPYTDFWGKLTAEDNRIVEESLKLVGITDLASRMVHTLSDGEKQKVMIAKALAQETPIIFLDEPTAFLDFPSKVEMMILLRKLSQQTNKTIFLSTHDVELALQIADKIWLMSKTEGIAIDTPQALSDNGIIEKFFCHKDLIYNSEERIFKVMQE